MRFEESVAISASAGKVYLVDDNDAFRASTAWLLDGFGYQVCDFNSGESFLAAVMQAPAVTPSALCVLLDIRMPGLSGLQVHKVLRGNGIGLPVVLSYGHTSMPPAHPKKQSTKCFAVLVGA